MYDQEMVRIASRPRVQLDKERPWVLRDGGGYFVCANSNCDVHINPINADENAAANIGLRFLRGVDAVRLTLNATGKIARSIGYVVPGTVLQENKTGAERFWNATSEFDKSKRRAKKAAISNNDGTSAATDEDDDETGGALLLFRDPSGGFRSADRWFESKVFWPSVMFACASGINAAKASLFGASQDD
jgi:hypothetical protein